VPQENILQLLPGAPMPSKEQLASYWTKEWRKALKYLGRRPLKLVRHVQGTTFYHKVRCRRFLRPCIGSPFRSAKAAKARGCGVDDLEGLLGLIEIGAVELDPWNSAVDDIEHPDVLVLDLNPGESVEWTFVRETALRLRELLNSEGHDNSWPKLTGGKGVHVMVPIETEHDA